MTYIKNYVPSVMTGIIKIGPLKAAEKRFFKSGKKFPLVNCGSNTTNAKRLAVDLIQLFYQSGIGFRMRVTV
jgi:hypothetical protein